MAVSTNVPVPAWGPNGFIAPQESDVLAGTLADINAAFGGNLNLDLTTPQGQLASSEAAVISNAYAIFLKYTTQVDPAFAEGRMQDAIARIYFIERNAAQPTVVQGVCTGAQGVNIPAGSLAIAADGNIYVCTDGGTIGVSGSITLTWACQVVGPIACPAGSLDNIYRNIPGWDSINNPADGVLGNNVETRAEFEQRRAASVALNATGFLPAIKGAVLAVPNVIDCYATENDSNSPATIGGVLLGPNSLYVCVVGGDAQEVAEAIWSRKAPGCAYTGTTTVTVLDTSPGYVPPYPAYSVSFTYANPLETLFSVNIVNSSLVPSDAVQQIQNAIVGAFAGLDAVGTRVKIGTELLASRFYSTVALLGSWAQIIDIEIGSTNNPSASFTAAIAGTNMTVSAVASGTLAPGQTVLDASGHVAPGTTIVSQTSGTTGGTGIYVVSNTQTVASEAMQTALANRFSIVVDIDQVPVTSPAFITVALV